MTKTTTTMRFGIMSQRGRRLRAQSARRGSVIFLCFVVLIALLLIVASFVQGVAIESMLAENESETVIGRWAALGAIEYAATRLELDERPEFDSYNEPWAKTGLSLALGDTDVEWRVVDEDSKFNLLWCVVGADADGDGDGEGAADDSARTRGREILVRLITRARNEENESLRDDETDAETLADAIIEWLRDTDASGGQEGSLSESEPGLGQADNDVSGADIEIDKISPYVLLTIGELLQIPGVNRRLLYGPAKRTVDAERVQEDADSFAYSEFDAPLPGQELGVDDDGEPTRIGLIHLVTAFTRQSRRININTASKPLLMALSEEMTEEIADAIIEARTRPPDEEEEEALPLEGEEEADDDEYSFRARDVSALAAFVQKLGEEAPEIPEPLWAEIGSDFTVISDVFMISVTARPTREIQSTGERTIGRIHQTWRAYYVRTLSAGDRENLSGQDEDPAPPPPYRLTLMMLDRVD